MIRSLLLCCLLLLLAFGAHGRQSEFARKKIDWHKLEEEYGVDEPPPPPIWGHSKDIGNQLSHAFLDEVCSDANCAKRIDQDWGHLLRSGGLEWCGALRSALSYLRAAWRPVSLFCLSLNKPPSGHPPPACCSV